MSREERITFQDKTRTRSTSGESSESWSDISTDPTMWAEAMDITGNEDFSDNQEGGFLKYRFKILYRSDINESMRISWNGKYWNIRSVTPVHKGMRHAKTQIIAEWRDEYYQ